MPTQFGCERYKGNSTSADATVVTLLRQAGCLVYGKTATHEFAIGPCGDLPLTRNPLDLERSPGGSSSGSAAAVADFQVPLSIGTQTGGSVTCPASYCGVVGYKPTHGTVSLFGAWSLAPSYDTLGLFARDVKDMQRLAHVVGITPEPKIQPATNGKPLRIAVCRLPGWSALPQKTRDTFNRAVAVLETDTSFIVEEVALPAFFDNYRALILRAGWKEIAVSFAGEAVQGLEGVESEKWRDILEKDSQTTWQEHRASLDALTQMKAHYEELIMRKGAYDSLVTLSMTSEAPIDKRAGGEGVAEHPQGGRRALPYCQPTETQLDG